jgi:hypothetical protein
MLLCVSIAGGTRVGATVLPDACGRDEIRFKVTTEKGRPAPAAPEAGKAQIVFVETIDKDWTGTCIGCNVLTRVGVDGAWVGANKGVSYFAYTVEPGEHHLCANWQSVLGSTGKDIGVASFVAEPGKVYYFQVAITMKQWSVDGFIHSENRLDLKQLSDDEGRYLVKVSPLSAAIAKE